MPAPTKRCLLLTAHVWLHAHTCAYAQPQYTLTSSCAPSQHARSRNETTLDLRSHSHPINSESASRSCITWVLQGRVLTRPVSALFWLLLARVV
jgi:hypothetical protein